MIQTQSMFMRQQRRNNGAWSKTNDLYRRLHAVQKRHSTALVVLLLVASLLELASLALYAYADIGRLQKSAGLSVDTYFQGTDVFAAQSALCAVFLVEWLVLLAVDEYKWSFILSMRTLTLLLTAPLQLIFAFGALADRSWEGAWVPLFLRTWWLFFYVDKILDFVQGHLITDLHRDLTRNIMSLFSTMITCIGVFACSERFTGAKPLDLFESLYFIVVTFGTIGYGDITPTSDTSRLITIVIIVVAIYKFPLFFSNLAAIAKQEVYYTSFGGGDTLQHVIVAGSLDDRDVTFFLNEFFAGVRRFLRLKIVLLSDKPFSQETQLLVTSPVYAQRVTLIIGSPMKRTDLERCNAASADAIFLVGKSTLLATQVDYETVVRCLAVHQFDSQLPQHVMLKRERNSKFLTPFVSSVMEKERLKMSLLGLGATLPGVIPLLVNLIRTCTTTERAASLSPWTVELERSMDAELYAMDVPEALLDCDFSHIVAVLLTYNVAAVAVVCAEGDVRLNPAGTKTAQGDRLIMIADDEACVRRAVASVTPMALSAAAARLRERAESAGSNQSMIDAGLDDGPAAGPAAVAMESLQEHEPFAEPSPFTEPSPHADPFAAIPPLDTERLRLGSLTGTRPTHSARRRSSTIRMSRPFVSWAAAYKNKAPPVAEAMVEVTTAEERQALTGHYIIIDLASAFNQPAMPADAQNEAVQLSAMDIFNVLQPIKCRDDEAPLVLLSRSPQNPFFEDLWRQKRYEPVRHITGCGLNVNELALCNVREAKGIVIFASGETSEPNADAMSLLVALSVRNLLAGRPVPVLTEVENIESLRLFPPYYTEDRMSARGEENFAYEPSFVTGTAICGEMLDSALYQTYFNPHILRTIDALTCGTGRRTDVPGISAMALTEMEPDIVTYAHVAEHCLAQGVIPIGLYRTIDDPENRSLNGLRYMFTNPHGTVLTRHDDIVYYISK